MSPDEIVGVMSDIVTRLRAAQYAHTPNPLYVWEVIHSALIANRPPPTWARTAAIAALGRLIAPGGTGSSRTIAAALGFASAGGPAAWRRARTLERHIGWGRWVAEAVTMGETLETAWAEIAAVEDVSYELVRAAFYRTTTAPERRAWRASAAALADTRAAAQPIVAAVLDTLTDGQPLAEATTGCGLDVAMARVAEARGLSIDTVWEAWWNAAPYWIRERVRRLPDAEPS